MTRHRFQAELWSWDARRSDTWIFVTVPREVGEEIEHESLQRGPRKGFGSVRVAVTIGSTTWQTSVFPDKSSESYVLPVKKAVRLAEDADEGDRVLVELEVV